MSHCCDANPSICPCGGGAFPVEIFNRPGLSQIGYRVGDFTAFRNALLQAGGSEAELAQTVNNLTTQIWRPSAIGDLGVQMMEWWAYLADILTFYNQRVATQAYLETADLPQSTNRLVKLLGYRPKPGIGAIGTVAAQLSKPGQLVIPRGFQIQSKPGPGKQPQVFEVIADTIVGLVPTGPGWGALAGGVVAAEPAPAGPLLKGSGRKGSSSTIVVKAASVPAKVGDEVLILPPSGTASFGLGIVTAIASSKNASLGPITTITLTFQNDASALIGATALEFFVKGQSTPVWQYPAGDSVVVKNVPVYRVFRGEGSGGGGRHGGRGQSREEYSDEYDAESSVIITGYNGVIQLDTIVKGMNSGERVLFQTSPADFQLLTIKGTANTVWFANPGTAGDPTTPQTARNVPSIAIPTTTLTLNEKLSLTPADLQANRGGFMLWHSWVDAGSLVGLPPTTAGGPGGTLTLSPAAGASFPTTISSSGITAQVADSVGTGATGAINSASQLTLGSGAPLLIPPLSAYFNLLAVTRGKTVANEVLGSGNAAIAGQDFTLQNAPVTYLSSAASTSGDGYASTVAVWVNQVRWTEVQSFLGQPADAQVFVTREDEQGKTHVVFGDSQFGARLPTGVNNVTATYRYGSGAEAPPAGSLTVVLKPQPGLRSIRNAIAVGAGADPDPPHKARLLAPKSVLTFGRAVSADDFQVIAAQANGVTRAAAGISFDAVEQRPRLTVWVGDNAAAVASATRAIAAQADPNRLPQVVAATRSSIFLTVALLIDRKHDVNVVRSAVYSALLDPDSGLLGVNVVKIGQAFFDSQIDAVCRSVPGVTGVDGVEFNLARRNDIFFRFRQGGGYAQRRHDPGAGCYFFLPDDGHALTILPPPEAS